MAKAKVYLDTNVLGHWILYWAEPPEVQQKAEKLARESLQLLQQIDEGWYDCEFFTSMWARAELAQTLRDNIVAGKILRDGQSLVYFNKLKDFYTLDPVELTDIKLYLFEFNAFLASLGVTVLRTTFDESAVQFFATRYGVDTSDAIHLAISKTEAAYLVTGDIRLVRLVADIQEVNVVKPGGLHTIRQLRRTRH